MRRALATALVASAAGAALACRDHAPPPAPADAARPRRVIEKPVGEVHAMPPFAIHGDGVGPYRLDVPLSTVLYDLPLRVTNLDVPGLVHLSVVRAENDEILIGGEPLASTSFVAVIGDEVARTDGGIEVGSTTAQLMASLGQPRPRPERVSDPRMTSFAALPNARFLVDHGRVIAIVVLLGAGGPDDDGSGPALPPCAPAPAQTPVPPAGPGSGAGVAGALAGLDVDGANATTAPSCLTAAGDNVVVAGEEVIVASRDLSHRLVATTVPGLVFAAPVRGDGHDDLVMVRVVTTAERRQWLLSSWRLEAGHLVRTLEEPLYDVSSQNADWLGARLTDLDLVLDIEARVDTLVASGVLLDRDGRRVRDAVPLTPVTIGRRRRPMTPPPVVDGGVPAAGVDAGVPDAAHASRSVHAP